MASRCRRRSPRVTWEDRTPCWWNRLRPGSLTESVTPGAQALAAGTVAGEAGNAFHRRPDRRDRVGRWTRTPGYERTLIYRAVDFFNELVYQPSGELIHLDAPSDASSVAVHRDWILIELRTDWNHPPAFYPGRLPLAADYEQFLDGTAELATVFEPDEHLPAPVRLDPGPAGDGHLTDVASRVDIVTLTTWTRTPARGLEPNSNTAIVTADHTGDEIFLDSSGFLTPSRFVVRHHRRPFRGDQDRPGVLRLRRPDRAAVLRDLDDGTRVPYFVVGQDDCQSPQPTLLGGYGGFEVSQTPGTPECWAGCGWRRAAPTRWPTSVAGRVRPRAGTPRRCARPAQGGRGLRRGGPGPGRTGITTPELLGAQGGSNGADC